MDQQGNCYVPGVFTGPYVTFDDDTVFCKKYYQYYLAKFDRNGNIIRYDSTYTYIYTYPNGNKETINIDSIFNSFRPYFFDRGIDLMQKPFIDFFDSDSSFQQHFFDHDYFMNQFEMDMFRFEEMIHEIDSLRNLYLKEKYPEMKQKTNPKPEKENVKSIEI